MPEVSDNKTELEIAMQEFLEQEKRKEFVSNNKRPIKKRRTKEENIIFISYPVGNESS